MDVNLKVNMSDKKLPGLSEVIEKMRQMKHETTADYMKIFATIAPYYNEYVAELDSSAQKYAVKVLSDVVEKDAHCDKSSMSIIDFAAGTGLICKKLREMGFKGAIDAQDGSDAMLAIGAPLYRQTFCFLLEENTKIPPELSNGAYDASVLCGGFFPSQVEVGCLKFIIDAVRPGGYVVFTLQLRPSYEEFVERLERKCSDLEKEGVWKLQSRLRVEKFQIIPYHFEKKTSSDYLPGLVLCYQKIA